MTKPTGVVRFLRWFLLLAATLAVPILPLLVVGLSFEARLEEWLAVPMTMTRRFWLIVGLLSTDLLLPIPSSAVSTYGGGRLGFGLATLASTLGMTIGGWLGYAAGRWLGEPFVERAVGKEDLADMEVFTRRFGPLAILATRPLPILAEACILLMGVGRLPQRRLWPPLLAANLLVSAIYSAFGVMFQSRDAMPYAVMASAIVPILFALVARQRLRRHVRRRVESE